MAFLWPVRKKLIFWTGLLGAVLFMATAIIGGLQFQAYSHINQFISETYASGTPWGNALRYGGFIPAGALLLLFGLTAALEFRKYGVLSSVFAGFGIFYGLGTIMVSIWPCDLGCDPQQLDPSIAHLIHFAVGSLTYIGTPVCMFMIAHQARLHPSSLLPAAPLLIAAIVMSIAVFVLFFFPPPQMLGLCQRIIEGSALLFVVVVAFQYQRRKANVAVPERTA